MEPFTKEKFYEIFKFGMEFEMETQQNHNIGDNHDYIQFVNDGSINKKVTGSLAIELISKEPIGSKEHEQMFFNEMKEVVGSFKSKNGEDVFAHYNTSCGTHFHWSFKDYGDDILSIFDCIEFEKFFFTKYMDTFKSEKFLSRINTRYCQSKNLKSAEGDNTKPHKIKADLKDLSLLQFQGEHNGDRYRWLNMHSVTEGTGAEIRVFPFIQTYAGAEQVTLFMQEVLYEFFTKPETQQKIRLIELYEKYIKTGEFKKNKLSELKKMAYETLMNYAGNYGLSGESKMFLASWIDKQPSLINTEKAL